MKEKQTDHTIINTMDLETDTMHPTSVWVFGYGSLIWKPDFNYAHKETGYIRGFKRRFWQGNATHRGTKEKLARVATLIKSSKKSKVWGVAFEIKGKEAMTKALGGLTKREITLGGYEVIKTTFHPRDNMSTSKPVVLYIATKDNDLFLGKAPIDTMAREIVVANGDAGSNIEYVTRLADYIKNNIPEDSDRHLLELDRRIRELSHSHVKSDIINCTITNCIADIKGQCTTDLQDIHIDITNSVKHETSNETSHETVDHSGSVDTYKTFTLSDKIFEIGLSLFKFTFKGTDEDHKHRILH